MLNSIPFAEVVEHELDRALGLLDLLALMLPERSTTNITVLAACSPSSALHLRAGQQQEVAVVAVASGR